MDWDDGNMGEEARICFSLDPPLLLPLSSECIKGQTGVKRKGLYGRGNSEQELRHFKSQQIRVEEGDTPIYIA
jgi:hypothetical protein